MKAEGTLRPPADVAADILRAEAMRRDFMPLRGERAEQIAMDMRQ